MKSPEQVLYPYIQKPFKGIEVIEKQDALNAINEYTKQFGFAKNTKKGSFDITEYFEILEKKKKYLTELYERANGEEKIRLGGKLDGITLALNDLINIYTLKP